MLHDPAINLDIFKRIFNNLHDFKAVSSKSIKEIIKDDGFQTVLMIDCGRNNKVHETYM